MRHLLAAALWLMHASPERAKAEERAWSDQERRLARLCTIIETQARAHGVDSMLLLGMAFRESTLNPSALGKDGEVGLFQLRLPVVRKLRPIYVGLTAKQLLEPGLNTAIAAWYLADLIARKHSVRAALVRYNGSGPRARRYAKRVLATLESLREFRPGAS